MRILLLILSLAGLGTAAESVPQRQSDFMPIGLYWAGEYVWRDAANQPDWAKVDEALTDMAKRSVNALWITHLTATQTAEMARRAAAHNIYLVASVDVLDGSVAHIRQGDHQALLNQVLTDWGDAPKPLAWGLGDEPRTAYMSEMASYVKNWRTFAPGEPVTTVVMHNDLAAAVPLKFDALSADIYPFFSAGNPNGYGIPDWKAWTVNSRYLAAVSPKPWMMGQSYQEPWGPYEVDTAGNIVYLPGGAPHWIFPTPEQISWQALSTFATGSKGMFYFHYREPTSSNPGAAAANLPAAAQAKTDSKAPRAMVYPDGRPTLQYDAMAEAFSWIAKRRSILAPLKESEGQEAWEVKPAKTGGNVVSMLLDPATQKRWLMVVASYDQPAGEPVRFQVGPHIQGLKAAADGKERAILKVAGSFWSGEVLLAPGTAALFTCSVDAKNLPTSYRDDFTTDRFSADAVSVRNVRRHSDLVLSASGGEDAKDAEVIYDLGKWLPALPAGGIRTLTYEGVANPPDMRGAFWSTSPDQQTWTPLSANEFGKTVFLKDRYLKVGLSWKQSQVAFAYGCLSGFAVTQWSRPAKH